MKAVRLIGLALLAVVCLGCCVCDLEASGGRRGRPQYAPGSSKVQPASDPYELKPGVTRCDDALEEVNKARAKAGLQPFKKDAELTKAAKACAEVRAASHIAGHLKSDFAYLPAGATAKAAGCGALEPSWGWGTCCTYDGYGTAGAAWVLGSDGKRYMHLFVK